MGKPPHCEMTLRAAMPDGSTPPDLTLPVTITGVKEPIILERKANAAIVFVHESNQELGKIYFAGSSIYGLYSLQIRIIVPCICVKHFITN